MEVRAQVADFLQALITVYTLCIIGWIVASLVFSLGARMPYSRPLNAVLNFLRDVSEPFLRVFRRLGLQIGPFDLSPMIAILVLQIGGSILIGVVDPG